MSARLKSNTFTSSHYLAGFGILIILALILGACGGAPPVPPTEASPQETEETVAEVQPTEPAPTEAPQPELDMEQVVDVLWVLLGFGDAANPTVINRDLLISVVFSDDGQVSGTAGCNNYSSTYTVEADGSLIIATPFAVTMMFCPRGMEEESAYLGALENARFLSVNPEGRLEIMFDSGQPYDEKLVYALGETSLVDTQWLLTGYSEGNDFIPLESGTSITASFSEDGNIAGFGGCNAYAGGYEVDGNQISIGPLAATASFCEDSSEQEAVYLAALESAETFSIFGQRLSIIFNDGDSELVFTSANLPLTGTLWTLNAVDGQPIPEEFSITAIFQPGTDDEPGRVAGSAGCNDYTAGYEVDDDQLTISTPAATRKLCETGMDEETAYLSAIEGIHSFEILGDTMDLVTDAGTLTYVADRTPLRGALWVLVSLGDVDEPQAPVEGANFTAQFTRNPESPSGVVAGTTGCNEYSAAYVSNEQEIKINLPQKTLNESCVPGLFEQEQAYFLAMNDASSYSILGNTLILPYDGGRQALVFNASQTEIAGKRPLAELDQTQWFLHFTNNAPILPGTLMDARFSIAEDGLSGTLSGSAGCNSYHATFGESLGVETTLTSTTTCFTPDGIMIQEKNFVSSLSRTYGYWLTGNQLVLNTGQGALTFRKTPPDSSQDQTHLLQNVKWYLINYNQQPSVVGNAEPFIFLNLDFTFSGSTGCNQVSGNYETGLDQITFSNISSGDQACPDETSDKQERVILANLNEAEFFVVADTTMQLGSDRGTLYYSSIPVERPEPTEPPVAVIGGPTEASVGDIVRFDGSNSTSDIGITNYRWDFGDGKQGDGPVVENIYIGPGTFTVTLTVVDEFSARGSQQPGDHHHRPAA